MGTRADFYVGRGENAGWIGSYAWDGHPGSLDEAITAATTEREYRDAVKAALSPRDDSTFPEQGWPWPWDNSQTTDYAYAWDDGKLYGTCFAHGWWLVSDGEPDDEDEDDEGVARVDFPDMKPIQKIDFGARSGIMIIGGQS